jgi:hypothetical protein
MTATPPILRQGSGLKPPEIRTVGSLERYIPKNTYSQVYWLAQIRPQDNVIIEAHPMKSWYFAPDGRLIGEIDTGAWQRTVEINPDEYIVLSVK